MKNIFLDLDGTLVDSLPDLTAALNQMLNSFDLPDITQRQVGNIIGKGFPATVKKILGLYLSESEINNVSAQALSRVEKFYNKLCGTNTVLYPNVLSTLSTLSSTCQFAIVTNKNQDQAYKVVEKTGLDKYIKIIIGGDYTQYYKPHPLPLQTAMKKLNATAKNSVMVGDSITDFECAKNADLDCILVDYGYSGEVDLTALPCKALIHDFSSIIDLV